MYNNIYIYIWISIVIKHTYDKRILAHLRYYLSSTHIICRRVLIYLVWYKRINNQSVFVIENLDCKDDV